VSKIRRTFIFRPTMMVLPLPAAFTLRYASNIPKGPTRRKLHRWEQLTSSSFQDAPHQFTQ
jgi:hypothetical protein